MKVNLNVPFMNYKGLVITKKVEGTDVEQEQLMKDVIAPILFSGEWRDERVNALSGDEKIRAYSLSLKIYQSTGNIEISAEEALMIKEAALVLNPGGYAQIDRRISYGTDRSTIAGNRQTCACDHPSRIQRRG